METCDVCREEPARHTIYGREIRRLCCSCNYAESGVASDWHRGCIEAARVAAAVKAGMRVNPEPCTRCTHGRVAHWRDGTGCVLCGCRSYGLSWWAKLMLALRREGGTDGARG
jgi:hypothetical protein